MIEHAAHLLPAQGPISVFVHHNTLHAFEDLDFEAAVLAGAERFGCQPYLSEERFRAELAGGRILVQDLRKVLEEDLGPGAHELVAGLTTRLAIRLAMVEHSFSEPDEAELAWVLTETRALEHLRSDLPPDVRRRLLNRARSAHGRDRSLAALETLLVRDLWAACYRVAKLATPLPPPPPPRRLRLRDRLLAAVAVDAHALVHPLMIRLAAAFLDQGIAYWSLPGRERGFYRAFLDLYGAGVHGDRWTADLGRVLRDELAAGGDALDSIAHSLDLMGVADDARAEVITATLLALRGWAGMFWQAETRPDRMPVHAVPATLADFLAVYLLVERGALAFLAREHLGHTGPLAELGPVLDARLPPPLARLTVARAGGLFQVAQVLGLDGPALAGLNRAAADALLGEIEAFHNLERRRIFHLAYERRHRLETLDALAAHVGTVAPPAGPPAFQAVFCIDEREESFRRHLEEVAPECETFGYAGFFGVAMYYRGVEDNHPVPLCPIAIRPEHEVEEVVDEGHAQKAELRARGRRALGRLRRGFDIGTRTFTRGTLLTATLGLLAVVPLVFRILFPRLTAAVRRTGEGLMRAPAHTHLELDRRPDVRPQLGKVAGFTKDEMAAIVRKLLEDT
ncbi:MAG TPA: putative inorganic carbon transporter subunit DabA, partial [Nannocystis sp.]